MGKASAFAWQRKLVLAWWGCSMSSMSRALVCISATINAYSRVSNACVTWAIRSWSSSTIAETILAADYVLDLGPGAGEHGGHLVAAGPPAIIAQHPESLTGKYLSGTLAIPHSL